jgi:hypothetical protein
MLALRCMARMWARALMAAAHDALLMRVFDQAHLVEQAAQVALLVGAQSAVAHPRTHRLQPSIHAALQARMDGKRVPDGAAVFQQLGHLCGQLGRRQGPAHTQSGGRSFWPQTDAIPNFALQVFGLAKQRGLAFGRDHQRGLRLGETRQVIKIAVVAVQVIAVAVALTLGCGGDDGNAARAQLGGQAGTAVGVQGVVHARDVM